MKYYDISPLINKNFAVFPGDVPFSLLTHSNIIKGNSCTLSKITTTLHLGAHADAPNHYHINGPDISNRSLNYYFGNCQVIDLSLNKYKTIDNKDIKLKNIQEKRILIKTNSWINSNTWKNNFSSFSSKLIFHLSKKNVILIGIDTPSIDKSNSKFLNAHNAVYKCNIAVLECLSLQMVPEGRYFLIALPLPIFKGDASPVRAILLPYKND